MRIATLAVVVILATLAMACSRGIKEGPYKALSIPQTALEERDTVVILDGEISGKVLVQNQGMRRDSQGRLEVFANLQNRTHYNQAFDVQTVFKNPEGFALDTSAWRRLTLGPNESQTYSTISLDDRAARYTIRIRQGQ